MKLIVAQRGLRLASVHESGRMTFEPFDLARAEWVPDGITLPKGGMFPYGFLVAIDSPIVARVHDRAFALEVQGEIDGALNRLSVAARAATATAGWWSLPPTSLNAIQFSEEVGYTHSGDITPEQIDLAMSYREDEVVANRFALNRYRRALNEVQDWIDPAMNVAIALEALLMRGVEAPGEQTEQICLRGAHFIGGDAAARKSSYDILRRTYKTRSKIVHNGGIEKPEVNLRNENEEAFALFARAAEKVLLSGYPTKAEWQAMLLGGDTLGAAI